jgi:hypothetical protein
MTTSKCRACITSTIQIKIHMPFAYQKGNFDPFTNPKNIPHLQTKRKITHAFDVNPHNLQISKYHKGNFRAFANPNNI